jgi:predicted transcriptional regulator
MVKDRAGDRKGLGDPDFNRCYGDCSWLSVSFTRFTSGRYTMVGVKVDPPSCGESPGPPVQVMERDKWVQKNVS